MIKSLIVTASLAIISAPTMAETPNLPDPVLTCGPDDDCFLVERAAHLVAALDQSKAVWHKADPGTPAFLGDDGGGVDTATVCDTVDRYREWREGGSPAGCQTFQHDLPVVVEVVIFDYTRDSVNQGKEQVGLPIAKIHIPSQKFVGYKELDALHPVIPPGTVINIKPSENIRPKLYLNEYVSDRSNFIEIDQQSRAKVIRYDPSSDTRWDLQVTILDGPHTGKNGWMLAGIHQETDDGLLLGMFSNAVIYPGGPSLR
jgi:hypothetical protein